MCLSRIGQIIYGLLALTTIGLIAASMFTPGWRSLTFQVNSTINSLQNGNVPDLEDLNFGIFFCQIPTATVNTSITNTTTIATTPTSTAPNQQPSTNQSNSPLNRVVNITATYCADWWNHLNEWEKVVVFSMVIALITALLAFIWNILAFCACFCKGGIMRPLAPLAGLTALSLAVGLTIFYFKNESSIQSIPVMNFNETSIEQIQKEAIKLSNSVISSNRVSYSFYLGCGTAIFAFLNMIVGTLIVCLADKCL